MEVSKITRVYDWFGDAVWRTRTYTHLITPSGKEVVDYQERSVIIYSIKGHEDQQDVKGSRVDIKT
jgi:aminopeptidase-like protein